MGFQTESFFAAASVSSLKAAAFEAVSKTPFSAAGDTDVIEKGFLGVSLNSLTTALERSFSRASYVSVEPQKRTRPSSVRLKSSAHENVMDAFDVRLRPDASEARDSGGYSFFSLR